MGKEFLKIRDRRRENIGNMDAETYLGDIGFLEAAVPDLCQRLSQVCGKTTFFYKQFLSQILKEIKNWDRLKGPSSPETLQDAPSPGFMSGKFLSSPVPDFQKFFPRESYPEFRTFFDI